MKIIAISICLLKLSLSLRSDFQDDQKPGQLSGSDSSIQSYVSVKQGQNLNDIINQDILVSQEGGYQQQARTSTDSQATISIVGSEREQKKLQFEMLKYRRSENPKLSVEWNRPQDYIEAYFKIMTNPESLNSNHQFERYEFLDPLLDWSFNLHRIIPYYVDVSPATFARLSFHKLFQKIYEDNYQYQPTRMIAELMLDVRDYYQEYLPTTPSSAMEKDGVFISSFGICYPEERELIQDWDSLSQGLMNMYSSFSVASLNTILMFEPIPSKGGVMFQVDEKNRMYSWIKPKENLIGEEQNRLSLPPPVTSLLDGGDYAEETYHDIKEAYTSDKFGRLKRSMRRWLYSISYRFFTEGPNLVHFVSCLEKLEYDVPEEVDGTCFSAGDKSFNLNESNKPSIKNTTKIVNRMVNSIDEKILSKIKDYLGSRALGNIWAIIEYASENAIYATYQKERIKNYKKKDDVISMAYLTIGEKLQTAIRNCIVKYGFPQMTGQMNNGNHGLTLLKAYVENDLLKCPLLKVDTLYAFVASSLRKTLGYLSRVRGISIPMNSSALSFISPRAHFDGFEFIKSPLPDDFIQSDRFNVVE